MLLLCFTHCLGSAFPGSRILLVPLSLEYELIHMLLLISSPTLYKNHMNASCEPCEIELRTSKIFLILSIISSLFCQIRCEARNIVLAFRAESQKLTAMGGSILSSLPS